MKTIKYILLIFVLSCSTMLMATGTPVYQTSSAAYKSIGAGSSGAGGASVGGSMRGYSGTAVCPVSAAPTVTFHSTSSMQHSGSNLPSAAITGTNTTYNQSGFSPVGQKRVLEEEDEKEKPEGWEDPFDDPLTDAVPCLLLLAVGYTLWLWRRKKAAAKG